MEMSLNLQVYMKEIIKKKFPALATFFKYSH